MNIPKHVLNCPWVGQQHDILSFCEHLILRLWSIFSQNDNSAWGGPRSLKCLLMKWTRFILFLIRLYEASQSKREAIGLLLLEDRGRQHVRSSLVEVPLYWRLVWHGDSLSSIPPMFFFIKKLCPHFIYYL